MRTATSISASMFLGLGPVLAILAVVRRMSSDWMGDALFLFFLSFAVLTPVVVGGVLARVLSVGSWATCLGSGLLSLALFVALWLLSFSLACQGLDSPFFRMSCN